MILTLFLYVKGSAMPSSDHLKTGVLLINLGSPDSPRPADLRRYLKQFLSDPRVMGMPAPLRWLILNAFILPFRPRKIQKKYDFIWQEQGFPLICHGQKLQQRLSEQLPHLKIRLGMRYGNPSLREALDAFRKDGIDELIVLPLFPQYASATTGSILEEVMRCMEDWETFPGLRCIRDFYDHPGFIKAWQSLGADFWARRPDHVLFSFHGLPESYVEKADLSGHHCLKSDDCCSTIASVNSGCYRAQCFQTARQIAVALGVPEAKWSVSFQSRMGRARWLGPYTTDKVAELASKGVGNLLVFCPSFVADCLETTEEILVEIKDLFLQHGGKQLELVPSLNSSDAWVEALVDLLERNTPR